MAVGGNKRVFFSFSGDKIYLGGGYGEIAANEVSNGGE